jgi:hypothetical protein
MILLLTIFFFIAPITIVFSGNWAAEQKYGFVKLYWIHPVILEIVICIDKKTINISLFKFIKFVRSTRLNKDNSASKNKEEGPSLNPLPENKDVPDNKKEYLGSQSQNTDSSSKETDTPGKEKKRSSQHLKNRIADLIGKIRRTACRIVFFSNQNMLFIKLLRSIKFSVGAMFKIFSICSYSINIRAGLDDPCETGRFYGYWIGAANALDLNNNDKKKISVEPAFNEKCVEISGSLMLKTSIMRFATPVAVIAFTFPYISTYRFWRATTKNIQ